MKAILIVGLIVLCTGRCLAAMDAKCVDRRYPANKLETRKVNKGWLVSIGYYSITTLWGKPKQESPKDDYPPFSFGNPGSS